MFLRKFVLASSAALLAMSAPHASAYEMKPMVIELRPSGQGSAASGIIRNTHQEPIAIELQVFARTQNPDGTDELVLDENDVIVTPPQMVIDPGDSQAFRIQWVGNPDPGRELSYRLVSNQLPIRFKKVERNDYTAEVTMRYRYEVALYIQPQGTQPSAQLQSAKVIDDGQGGRILELAISSNGTRRAILDKPTLELNSGGTSLTLESDQLGALIGLNILPGSTRIVRMPAPSGLPLGEISGSLKTTYLVVS